MTVNEIMMIVWGSFCVVSLIAEFLSTQLISLWFAVSSFVTLFTNFIPDFPVWAQMIIFFGLTIILLCFVRPIVNKISPKKAEAFNSDGYIGQRFLLLKDIKENETGEVKINDVIYSCKSIDNIPINKDEYVIVIDIKGNTFLVEADKKKGEK